MSVLNYKNGNLELDVGSMGGAKSVWVEINNLTTDFTTQLSCEINNNVRTMIVPNARQYIEAAGIYVVSLLDKQKDKRSERFSFKKGDPYTVEIFSKIIEDKRLMKISTPIKLPENRTYMIVDGKPFHFCFDTIEANSTVYYAMKQSSNIEFKVQNIVLDDDIEKAENLHVDYGININLKKGY